MKPTQHVDTGKSKSVCLFKKHISLSINQNNIQKINNMFFVKKKIVNLITRLLKTLNQTVLAIINPHYSDFICRKTPQNSNSE